MCIAQSPDPGARPVVNDAIPAATALELGAPGRGTQGLGRLKLRAGGTSQPTGSTPPASNSLAIPTDSASSGSSSLAAEGVAQGAIQRTPNRGLRIPIDPGP